MRLASCVLGVCDLAVSNLAVCDLAACDLAVCDLAVCDLIGSSADGKSTTNHTVCAIDVRWAISSNRACSNMIRRPNHPAGGMCRVPATTLSSCWRCEGAHGGGARLHESRRRMEWQRHDALRCARIAVRYHRALLVRPHFECGGHLFELLFGELVKQWYGPCECNDVCMFPGLLPAPQ